MPPTGCCVARPMFAAERSLAEGRNPESEAVFFRVGRCVWLECRCSGVTRWGMASVTYVVSRQDFRTDVRGRFVEAG